MSTDNTPDTSTSDTAVARAAVDVRVALDEKDALVFTGADAQEAHALVKSWSRPEREPLEQLAKDVSADAASEFMQEMLVLYRAKRERKAARAAKAAAADASEAKPRKRRPPHSRSATGSGTLKTTERRAFILEKRREGHSLEAIGRMLGISKVAVFHHVKAAVDELREQCAEDAETMRELELQRLDELTQTFLVLAKDGCDKAANIVLKAQERRAKLVGLDAPTTTKTELTGKDGGPIKTASATVDLTRLTTEQLAALEQLLSAAQPQEQSAQ